MLRIWNEKLNIKVNRHVRNGDNYVAMIFDYNQCQHSVKIPMELALILGDYLKEAVAGNFDTYDRGFNMCENKD